MSASRHHSKGQEVVAGLTTFAAMSYIMFTNPLILKDAGMPAGPVFLWTCITAAAASFMAGWRLNTPTAMACGMGLNLFVADYAIKRGVPWPYLLLTCSLVAIAVLALSVRLQRGQPSWRQKLITDIPPEIFAAIKGGIGALLAEAAIREIKSLSERVEFWKVILAFAAGVLVIVMMKWLYATKVDALKRGQQPGNGLRLLDSAPFIVSIAVMIPFALALGLTQSLAPEPQLYWAWGEKGLGWFDKAPDHLLELCIVFAAAAFFVLLLDIAGSPYEYVTSEEEGKKLSAEAKEAIIDRSLKIDSVANVLAPVAGVTPLVYYAENHAGWKAYGKTGLVAQVAAACFAVFAVIAIVSISLGRGITEFIPKFAIMPTLFFIGLLVTAESFVPPVPAPGSREKKKKETPTGRILYFVPAALTVVMVPATRFDYALAAGILSHAVISIFPESYIGTKRASSSALIGIYIAAFIVLVLSLR